LKFTKNIFFKNVSVLFLGTVISQAINIGGLPILSRMYGTTEFATLALFMAIGLIVLSFSTLQLDIAIVKTNVLEEKYALIRGAFLSVFIFSILTAIALLIWTQWNPQFTLFFILSLYIYFIVNAGNQIFVYFFNSEKKYRNIATARILLSSVNLIVAIFLFYWNPELGLIIALIIANCISLLCFLIFFGKQIKSIFQVTQPQIKAVFNKFFQFVKFSTPANFLDILSYQVVIIFLSKYFTEDITGSFFMAMRVVLLPTALIGNAISQVFYKDISDKFAESNLAASEFWKVWKFLFVVGIIPFTLLFLFGEILFGFVLGEEWRLAGQMGAILAISGFFIFLSSPTSTGFIVMNQQKYNLLNSSIRTIYTIILLIWSVAKNDIFFFLWCYAIAEFLMIILYNFVMLRLLQQQGKNQ